MINNPPRNIHTDYVANDVFKPKDANALAMSIPFDFVITKERVDEYREKHEYTQANSLDVGALIWEDYETTPDYTCGGRTAIYILINYHTTIEDRFDFGGWLSMLGSIAVHVYSLSSFRTCGTMLNIFYHTHGTENYVLFDESMGNFYRGSSLHVGSFMLWDNGSGYPQWHASAPFVYEQCIEGPVPTGGSGEPGVVVKQENWLSNGVGGRKNLITIGWVYEDTYDESTGEWTVDTRNPSSDEFIEKLDELLSNDIVPFVMYSCLKWTTDHSVTPPVTVPDPYDPSIDSRTNNATRISPLFDIQWCAYYFINPKDSEYTLRLKIGQPVSLRKSSAQKTYYGPIFY